MKYHILRNFVPQSLIDEILSQQSKIPTTDVLPDTLGNAFMRWKLVRSANETANGNPGIFLTLPLFQELFDVTADAINQAFGTTTEDVHRVDELFRVSRYSAPQGIPPHRDRPGNCEFTWLFELNDDFEGGEFVLDGQELMLNKGDMLLFNNRLIHEVRPVISGTRYAAFTKFKFIQ